MGAQDYFAALISPLDRPLLAPANNGKMQAANEFYTLKINIIVKFKYACCN